MREEIIQGDDSENIVGALVNQLQRFGARGRQAAQNVVTSPRFTAAGIKAQVGGGGESKLRAPLGIGFHTFTALGTFKFIVEPQEGFRGERLIVDVEKDGGAGVATLVNSIIVGSLPQTPSTEFGIPAVMFRADATDANMSWQICPAGTKIIIEVELVGAAIAEGDSVTVSLGVYGEWVRG
jgi:hypothetical protein